MLNFRYAVFMFPMKTGIVPIVKSSILLFLSFAFFHKNSKNARLQPQLVIKLLLFQSGCLHLKGTNPVKAKALLLEQGKLTTLMPNAWFPDSGDIARKRNVFQKPYHVGFPGGV